MQPFTLVHNFCKNLGAKCTGVLGTGAIKGTSANKGTGLTKSRSKIRAAVKSPDNSVGMNPFQRGGMLPNQSGGTSKRWNI